MPRLVSVNVGLPRDVEWRGRTVRTAIWKDPVAGRVQAGRLNIAGDGQGDLAGHGGEQRAVFVYQLESYRFWQERLKRNDFVPGQFGENFTIDGLSDDVVCVGDRYRIGTAVFEVTQPRVTCYRVGIRMNEPRMPALLTSSGRPGFYFRVLHEGEVGAGDEIVKVGEASVRLTVAEINALLYSPDHPRDRLQRALRVEALSPGWRGSFEALLESSTTGAHHGNAGLAPVAAAHPAATGFRTLEVTKIDRDSPDVLSLTMQSVDGEPLEAALPGQYVVLRLPRPAEPPVVRSYSLSGPISTTLRRISVKIEPNGVAGAYLRDHVGLGHRLEVSAPRGSFVLQDGDRPVVLVSVGIGATPVLAMLHALSASRSMRRIYWLHGARDREHHPFAAEVRGLVSTLAHARSYVCFSQPNPRDEMGVDFDAHGRLTGSAFERVDLPLDADAYACGPTRFMEEVKRELTTLGVAPARIHFELFAGSEPMNPGVLGVPRRAPHVPADDSGSGPLVQFGRSGIAAHWKDSYQSILELAEACDVPVRWSCRSGVCHSCECGLVSGSVGYEVEPLDAPADGNVLVCCARPSGDVVVDL